MFNAPCSSKQQANYSRMLFLLSFCILAAKILNNECSPLHVQVSSRLTAAECSFNLVLSVGYWTFFNFGIKIIIIQDRKYDLEDRLVDYTCRMIDVVDALPNTRAGNYIAGQLVRSCHSPTFNYREAQAA